MNFNIAAINWDNEARIKRAKIIADEIIESIHIKDQAHAMEFGCGTGLVSFNLIDKFQHITLIDTSQGMIETLNHKIKEFNVDNMTAIMTDINSDDRIQDQSFDVIYTSMAMHHIIDTKTTLKNLYAMLEDAGCLCIVDLTEDDGSFHRLEKDFNGHNGFNQEQLKSLMEEVGFKNVVSNVFYSDVKIIEDLEVNYFLFLMIGER